MVLSDWIGFIGVAILLVAFLLNLLGKLAANSVGYSLLNAVGAGMTCIASIMINYLPFIILEGVWTLVSLFSMVKSMQRKD